jgi:hypothetical protein
VSFLLEKELLIFIYYCIRGILRLLHLLAVKLDLPRDAFHVLSVEVYSIAKSLYSSLESNKVNISQSQSAFTLVDVVFFLWGTN